MDLDRTIKARKDWKQKYGVLGNKVMVMVSAAPVTLTTYTHRS